MTNTKSTKKSASKGRKPGSGTGKSKKARKDIFSNLSESALEQLKKFGDKLSSEKDIVPHLSDSTREQLKKLGDKISEATDKGVHLAKDVAEKVRKFTNDATELTKLKIEIHKLKSTLDRLTYKMGEKLISLQKSKKLKNVETAFKKDFSKFKDLKSKISKKEKAVKKISL